MIYNSKGVFKKYYICCPNIQHDITTFKVDGTILEYKKGSISKKVIDFHEIKNS